MPTTSPGDICCVFTLVPSFPLAVLLTGLNQSTPASISGGVPHGRTGAHGLRWIPGEVDWCNRGSSRAELLFICRHLSDHFQMKKSSCQIAIQLEVEVFDGVFFHNPNWIIRLCFFFLERKPHDFFVLALKPAIRMLLHALSN